MTITIISSILGILLFAGSLIWKGKLSVWTYLASLLTVCVVGLIGMDFSPSFTANFLFVFLCVFTLSEVIRAFLSKELAKPIAISGCLFLVPSIVIYSAGDNFWRTDMWLAGIFGVVVAIVTIWLYRKKFSLSVWLTILQWIVFVSISVYALLCSITSLALLPYGMGLLLVAISCLQEGWKKNTLAFVGLTIMNIFLWAPMAF